MKPIKCSVGEFKALVSRGDWASDQEFRMVEYGDRESQEENGEIIVIPYAWGLASKTSTSVEGVQITYTEAYAYDQPDKIADLESITTWTTDQHEAWSVEGVLVVDDDGHRLGPRELAAYLDAEFSRIDYNVIGKNGKAYVFDI